MKMVAQRRALDKLYKRRDRYEIPEWQRDEVWDDAKKQQLIDSILRGWRLPKFYFVKNAEDEYEVVDGQQRLNAIFDFFANELQLSNESAKIFGGKYCRDLKTRYSDAFDDFEIDYDEIEDATEPDLKQFFQRLQQGLPLTSSEKLNAVHSKLRDFCKTLAKHRFFKDSISVADTRFAHFDIASKAAVIEIEGIQTGLRYEDIKDVFEAQGMFPAKSAAATRLRSALDFLGKAFPVKDKLLKNRAIVQSVISLACKVVATEKSTGLERKFAEFVDDFLGNLAAQVELGQAATDSEFIRFQKSINANVKAGARTRQEILLCRAFMFDTDLAGAFDPSVLLESGVSGRIKELGEALSSEITKINAVYSASNGVDLFKATNKTISALTSIREPIKDLTGYKRLITDLYFVFRESVGQRLGGSIPKAFADVNSLRTDLQHDVDHGKVAKVKRKKIEIGSTFKAYAGTTSPDTLDPARFVLVQVNLLSALLVELRNLSILK